MRWRWIVISGAIVLAGCAGGGGVPAAGPSTSGSATPSTASEPPDPSEVTPGGDSTTLSPPEATEPVHPDLSGVTLGLRGLGPLQVGTSVNDLAALGYEIAYADCGVPYIRFEPDGLVAVRGGPNGDPSGEETLTGLYFWFGTPENPDERNRELRTLSGIGEGSTRADVLATYGDRVEELSVEIEDYEPEAQTFEDRIELIPTDTDDAGLRMIFSFDDDDVLLGIRTGEAAAIHEPFLCA